MTTAGPPNSLGNQVAAGAAWMVLFRLSERLIGLVSTVILARILLPEDFGLVAMATTVIALLEIFTMNDFASAIIQNPSPSREDYDTAWTMEVMLALSAGGVIASLAIPAAIYFGDPRVTPILLVLAIYPLLDAASNVGCVDFRKHLQFQKDFVLQVIRKVSGFIVCIPLAFLLRNHWALIIGILAARVGGLVASYAMHPFRPRPSLAAAGRIWRFARWIIVSNALAFLNARASHLVIGRMEGTRSLGLYSVAFDLANLPTSELSMPINRAVFPGYSKLTASTSTLKSGFLRVFGVVALAVIPAGIGVALIADLAVPLLLGSKWTDAIPLVQILAVAGAIAALQTNVDSVYLAMGLTRYRAQVNAVQVLILVPALILMTREFGLVGAAWAVFVTAIGVCAFNFWQVCRLLFMRQTELLAELWRPSVATATMVAVLWIVAPDGLATSGLLIRFATAVSLGAASYASALGALWILSGRPEGAETWAFGIVRQTLKRFAQK